MEVHLDSAIEILQRTPEVVNVLLNDLNEGWVMKDEGPDTWSAYDIIGHYIHGEITDWIPRMRIILDNDITDKTFEPFDRFAQFTTSRGKSTGQLIEEFKMLRERNIEILRSFHLTEEKLNSKGIHPIFGPVTLRQLLAAWVVHDLTHIHQLSRVMAKQYERKLVHGKNLWEFFNENEKVIIIGATSGIGRSLARLYIQRGDTVGITGRRNELLTSLKNEFSTGSIFSETFDVCGNDNIMHVRALIEKLGGLDLLIYNSGFGDVSEKLDWELDKKIYETNVKGFIEIVHFAFNYFATQGYGQIAATSSIASTRGNSFAPAYSASKAFMSVYMEGLHMKSRKMKNNIAITDIQPGFVNTKQAKGNKQFWVAPLEKAATQIFEAIEKEKMARIHYDTLVACGEGIEVDAELDISSIRVVEP